MATSMRDAPDLHTLIRQLRALAARLTATPRAMSIQTVVIRLRAIASQLAHGQQGQAGDLETRVSWLEKDVSALLAAWKRAQATKKGKP